ncbi:MAG: MFS transporter [Anaerolineae bacterium]|nr:MFS transporter [Anaerolineae bacterium]
MTATHRKRIVWTLALCTSLALFGDATLYAVLPAQYGLLAVSTAQVGWLLSVNRLVRLPLNLVSGWLADRLGCRGPYVIGVAVGALSTAAYGLLRGFWPLLISRALWGLAWSLLTVAAYGMILDASRADDRGRLTSIYASYSYFGGSVGMLLGGFLVDWLQLPRAMVALSLFSAIGVMGALTLPQTPPAPRRTVEPERPSLGAAVRASWQGMVGADLRLWVIAALNFAHRFFFAGVFYSTFGLYLRQAVGEEAHLGAWVIGVASLTSLLLFARNVTTIVTSPALGHLSDRLGDRVRVLVLGEVLGVAGLAAFAGSTAPAYIGAGVLLAAVAYGVVPPLLVAWLGDLTRAGSRGRHVGGYQTAGDLGSGLGPLAAYAFLPLLGIRWVYGLSAAFLALTVPLILWARTRAAQAEKPLVSEPA